MPHAKLQDFELYYESHGAAGAPLVLVPGFASGAWIWFRQVAELAKHFRVIVFDPRGVSRSRIANDLADTVSVATIAADVAHLLNELRIERAHVLGASFGGFVAQEFALNHADRLDKLVLVCTSAGGSSHVKADLEVLRGFTPDPNLSLTERIRKFMRPAFTPEFARADSQTIDLVCRLREENKVPEAVYTAQVTAAFTFDKSAQVRNIQAETLVITGDKDFVVPSQNSENLAREIPNARLEIIENSGHLFFIEKAAEFNRRTTQFLDG